MNIWCPDPVSASLLDLEMSFGEVLELNLRSVAHSSWSALAFVSSKMGKYFNYSCYSFMVVLMTQQSLKMAVSKGKTFFTGVPEDVSV